MTETEFNETIDELIMGIEDQLDDIASSIDYETSSGILTLTMDDGSQIIINRQVSHFQLWLAAKSGGFHFEYIDGRWIDTRSKSDFYTILNNCIFQQSGENIELSS
ncbi:MAG: iron donor protein CyaY [Gammaproteobacteria bacterium]|nr:iron donor protein CyaY [Gammaproteobacteria bacterium]